MKRVLLIFFLFSQFIILTGCSQLMRNRTEIDRIFNTRIIGIDKLEENKILFTITTKAGATNSQNSQEGAKASEILVTEGATVFEASRNMQQYAHKKPHYGHTEFVLFGEDTAKEGILPYLDFISRNLEFRYNAKIYIIRGDKANSFISRVNTGNLFLADKLSLMEDNAYAQSKTSKVTLSEALYIYSKKNVSTFLPVITIAPTMVGESQSEGNYDLIFKDYAIFRKDKLEDYLGDELSIGVNFVTNRIQSGIILIDAKDKKKVSMEIIESKTSIKPYMDENGLKCTINVKFNTNVAETLSKQDIFTEDGFQFLEHQQEAQVKKEIEKVLSYAQEKNMDFFGILTKFRIKYPMMKDELDEKWNELFPEIKFEVKVDSNVNRTYLIKDAATTQ